MDDRQKGPANSGGYHTEIKGDNKLDDVIKNSPIGSRSSVVCRCSMFDSVRSTYLNHHHHSSSSSSDAAAV
eukprot:scaffold6560_cov152-Chaetoceros_neogracile.AAC.6